MEVNGAGLRSRHPKFVLPVIENKAPFFRLVSVAKNTMRALYLPWSDFYSIFVFAIAYQLLIMILDNCLNHNALTDIQNQLIASLSGAVFARLVMRTACDLFDPPIVSAALLCLTSPAVYFCTTSGSSPISFLIGQRFFTGFSLSTFVSVTQYWMSTVFSARHVVGTANGIPVGLGDLGGGGSQLLLPLVFSLIQNIGSNHCVTFLFLFFFCLFL